MTLLFSARSGSIQAWVLGTHARAHTCSEKNGLQGRDTATDDAHVGFDGRPNPNLKAFPSNVIGIVQDVVHPVGAEATSDDDDATKSKENHEANSLRRRKTETVQSWHRQHVDHKVGGNIDDCLRDEWRAFRHAVTSAGEQIPIAADRTVAVLALTKIPPTRVLVHFGTYMHCVHNKTAKTTMAAKTIAKVAQTSRRKSDRSGAIRK